MTDTTKTETDGNQGAYQVSARKYRPQVLDDLVGQEAMVRILRNAFDSDRIAHAFILTGVRGVGKTTTARIIAKALNCTGPDGNGEPTVTPCGTCEACVAITEGRHVDVLEMDAASRTGVGDIREIIDGVRYRAASARYKVYIIDEVHMLSTSAFNALLKTLEEPPEHVKFLFATTEIRKVPVTVLSRCQRFDLRRIEPEDMLKHLAGIAQNEGGDLSDEALALITRASEGSMRDALSLLDQAMAQGAGRIDADAVRAMLGLADRGRVLDLFECVMEGDAAKALSEIGGQYADGADPIAVLRDLAEVTHWISIVKISPQALEDPAIGPDERARGTDFAARLPMRALTRMWQMLLNTLDEVARAPNAMMAAEMAIIRLTHVADLPSPEDLVRRLSDMPANSGGTAGPAPSHGGSPAPGPKAVGPKGLVHSVAPRATALASEPAPDPLARYTRFEDVVALIRTRRDMPLLIDVESHLRLASYSPGRIEFEPGPDAPQALATRLAQRLGTWTGTRWVVSIVSEGGAQTISEARIAARNDLEGRAMRHPLVQAALSAFPGAEIRDVRAQSALDDANPEDYVPIDPDDVPDDWDPFDPFDEE